MQTSDMRPIELVILDSSSPAQALSDITVTPPPPDNKRFVCSTSSPDSLPSPIRVVDVDKRVKSGSNAATIFQGAAIGFSPVSTLVKYGKLEDKPLGVGMASNGKKKLSREEDCSKNDSRSGKVKKQSKSIHTKTISEKQHLSWKDVDVGTTAERSTSFAEQVEKLPEYGQSCSKAIMQTSNKNIASNPESQKGIESKKLTAQSDMESQEQTDFASGVKSKNRRKPSVVSSKHFRCSSKSEEAQALQASSKRDRLPTSKELNHQESRLAPAIVTTTNTTNPTSAPKRRQNWTPVKDTASESKAADISPADLRQTSLSPTSRKLAFSGLLQNFAYPNANEPEQPSFDASKNKGHKRKHIECVEVAAAVTVIKETKTPDEPECVTTKKKTKLKSVTAFATERFRTAEDLPTVPNSNASKFFAEGAQASTVSKSPPKSEKQDIEARNPRKGSSAVKGGPKTKSKKGTGKKTVFMEPPVLKPEHAARHFAKHEEKHDFVFATSSQFHREKSPTMLRVFQRSFLDADTGDKSEFIEISAIEADVAPRKPTSGLWSAASEGESCIATEEMQSKEVVISADATVDQDQEDSLIIISENALSTVETNQDDGEIQQGDRELPTSGQRSRGGRKSPKKNSNLQVQSEALSTRNFRSASNESISRSQSMAMATSPERAALRALSTNTPRKLGTSRRQNPRHGEITNQKITLPTSSIPPRTPMRSLGSPSRQGTDTQVRICGPSKESPSSFQHLSEIEDSEADSAPTPPRRRRSKKRTPSKLDVVSSQDASVAPHDKVVDQADGKLKANAISKLNARHPKWADMSQELFPRITDVVKGVPRGPIGHPSWWEKMLMYDPIVIEDLTEWLKEQGVGVPKYKGGEREKEGELKGWMVQRWCDEKSICCQWRDGRFAR